MSDNRDMGVEFGELTDDLESESYPLTRADLLDRYGDRELEHASGETTLREVLSGEGQDEYDGPDAVHQAILNNVGTQAVGRDRYSDRGGSRPEEDEEIEDQPDSL